MAKKKLGKKKSDGLTNTLKQLYTNQANGIRKKITRRRQWAQEWTEKIQQIENDIQQLDQDESDKITQLKLKLESIKAEKQAKRSAVDHLEIELKENIIRYEEIIANLDVHIIQNRTDKTKEISDLTEKEEKIRYFMKNHIELYDSIKKRKEKLITAELNHAKQLEALRETRAKRTDHLIKEIEQKIKTFGEYYENTLETDDPVFETNANLREEKNYLTEEIKNIAARIPEAERNIDNLIVLRKTLARTSLASRKFTHQPPPSIPLSINNIIKPQQRDLKISSETQTDNYLEETGPITPEMTANRLKAISKTIEKTINEALALFLIPEGCLWDEKKLSNREQHTRYMARCEFIINRRNSLLEKIFEAIQPGNMAEKIQPNGLATTPVLEDLPEPSEDTELSLSSSSGASLPRSPSLSLPAAEDDSCDIWSLVELTDE